MVRSKDKLVLKQDLFCTDVEMSVFMPYTMIQSITVAPSMVEQLQALARMTVTDMGQALSVMSWTGEGSRVVVVYENVVRNIRNIVMTIIFISELEKCLEEKFILV